MNKHRISDDTLRELWMIKDETAQRFRTVAEYFQYLGLAASSSKVATRAVPNKRSRPRSGAADSLMREG